MELPAGAVTCSMGLPPRRFCFFASPLFVKCGRSLLCLAAVLLHPLSLQAERLILHNGNTVTGRIETETSDRITMRTANGRVSFSRAAVATIIRQTGPEQAVALAVEAASRGDLAGTLVTAADPSQPPSVRAAIDSALIRHSHVLLTSHSPAPSTALRLARYVEDRETSAPASLRLFLARYLAAAGDYSGAVRRLKELPMEEVQRDPSARAAASEILRRQMAVSLQGGDPQPGLESLQLLSRLAPEQITSSTRILLHMANARRLADNGAFESALDELGRSVIPAAPVLAWEEAGRCLMRAEQENSSPSVLAGLYERMHQYFYPAGFGRELLPFYQRHIQALIALGRFDTARVIAASRLSPIDPDVGAPFEHRIELAARQSALTEDDLLGRYRLGAWAREVGLLEEARQLLTPALADSRLKENAALQLQLVESEAQRREFEAAAGLFEKRQYEKARKALEAFRNAHPQSAYAKKAGELIELARYHLWAGSRHRPAEAEVLRQNAERLFLQARYDEALELLNRLEVEYSGTEAVVQGRRLRDQIQARTGKGATPVGSARPADDLATRRLKEMQALARELARQP